MFNNKKWGSPSSVLNYKHLKPKLRVLLTGYTIAMLTSEVKKINKTYSLIVGYLFDTIIVAATDKNVCVTRFRQSKRAGKC